MQIIIVGCGNVGVALTEQLSGEGHDVTVIEQRRDVIQTLVNNFDVMGIVGNGASYSVMKDAGIEYADLMIAVTGNDEFNLLCCLIARKAGHCNTIARVKNPIYKKEVDFIKEELGLSLIVNPEELCANEAARLLKFPAATKIETFARGRAEIVHMTVAEDSRIASKSLKDLQSEIKSKVLIAVVERNDEVFIPRGDFIICPGDELTIVGASRNIADFFRKIGLPTTRVRSAIIVGGGSTGYYLAQQLITFGIDVKLFDRDIERCKALSELLPSALIINADGTDKDTLMEEGLMGTESFVATTNVDEENIMLSMYVKSVNPKAKLITKVHRVNYGDIIDTLQIGSIVYPKHITAQRILKYVRGMSNSLGNNSIEALYKMNDGKVEALEFLVTENSKVIGVPLAEMNLKKGVIVSLINRHGEIISPTGQSTIQAGDTVIIITSCMGLQDISDILA
ncbi:Trk system potassium transporter TrkA [Butyrivibrio sp. NC2002]|uniref:Trk system potassium transporter TrkA n=1 Tax=Butyrivibrio sp. NC2002 TaxID=1410610 RepID=UPI000559CE18|nr:Trk system potassium transporter TrkA [Butyrivibrio sp. NC2002]